MQCAADHSKIVIQQRREGNVESEWESNLSAPCRRIVSRTPEMLRTCRSFAIGRGFWVAVP